MSQTSSSRVTAPSFASAHGLGVLCALSAGAWLGAAEAPTKLVNSGLSPYAISLCMVAGVFTARWTVPTLLKGTRQVFADLSENRHLIPIAILAGMLWAVANTLTVFAIRDVGLAIAFPLWNTNSLVGIFWGRVLFGELKGASGKNVAKVVLGALAIVAAAVMLGFSTIHGGGPHAGRAVGGVLAAAGASLLWGTMYVPYRKAYISGMNPLSFVTAFTIGELGTVFALVLAFDGGIHAAVFHSRDIHHMLFWLFLGGFVWVIGDIFQQYATKYLGIGRGIPLSNTNQLWGLAWGALVFGELAHADPAHRLLVVAGSIVMILGALAVSTAVATEREHASTNHAVLRECNRYGLDYTLVIQSFSGIRLKDSQRGRAWWDFVILLGAVGIFIWFGLDARVPALPMNLAWTAILAVLLVLTAVICVSRLWKSTRFS
ncbi:MAG TPA: GRP family sugar transporter [Terracidiphilus sp.]|nr:GRP family sugar transporter [Terracidiphilus sp.]